MKVIVPEVLSKHEQWEGKCGTYYGFEVRCDTDSGKPAEGAVVTGKFYNERWQKTVQCTIPVNQPVQHNVDWCEIGTEIPCSACGNNQYAYINIDLSVRWKGERWEGKYPKAIKVYRVPYMIIKSTDCTIKDGKVCAYFWLEGGRVGGAAHVYISKYRKVGNSWVRCMDKMVTLSNSRVEVCFPYNNEIVGLAPTRLGLKYVSEKWVCSKEWTIW